MFATFARKTPDELLIRTGHEVKDYIKAKARALRLKAIEVEIRDTSLPRSRSLIAVVSNGKLLEVPRFEH